MAGPGADFGSFGMVEDDLLVKSLVRTAQRRIIDGEEGQLGGDYLRDVCRRHACSGLVGGQRARNASAGDGFIYLQVLGMAERLAIEAELEEESELRLPCRWLAVY